MNVSFVNKTLWGSRNFWTLWKNWISHRSTCGLQRVKAGLIAISLTR